PDGGGETPPPLTPGAGTPAKPSVITVRLPSGSLRLDSRGRFAIKVSCPKGTASCKVRVLVKRGKTRLAGSKTVTIKPGATATVTLRPTSAMRRSLRRGSSVEISVSVSGTGIKTASKKLRVRPR
ncbi:MAG: amidase, partial [Solirubrobacteraceae bacterium]|nr:amidase [Solirubrobacteraceae bacterium]